MLVLSRKKNESIIINDDITIVVVEIRGDKVRLGVEAPKEVPVHRNEVYEAIRRNQPCDAAADNRYVRHVCGPISHAPLWSRAPQTREPDSLIHLRAFTNARRPHLK